MVDLNEVWFQSALLEQKLFENNAICMILGKGQRMTFTSGTY